MPLNKEDENLIFINSNAVPIPITKEDRRFKTVTQKDLAIYLGVGPTTISEYKKTFIGRKKVEIMLKGLQKINEDKRDDTKMNIEKMIKEIEEKFKKNENIFNEEELLFICGLATRKIKDFVFKLQKMEKKRIGAELVNNFNFGTSEIKYFQLKKKIKNLFLKYSYAIPLEEGNLKKYISTIINEDNNFIIKNEAFMVGYCYE